MNYAYQYFKLIAHRVVENRLTKKDCYVECHHVIPKSEGGKDTEDNLVNLTAREHYIAHLLLAKIYDDSKMYSAITYMQTRHIKGRNFKFNSHLYEKIRRHAAERHSEIMKGRHLSEDQRRKLSVSLKGKTKGKYISEDTRRKLSESLKGSKHPMFGKKRSEETRKKQSDALKGRVFSDEWRKKIKDSKQGKSWFTNGVDIKFCRECPDGYVKGRYRRIVSK